MFLRSILIFIVIQSLVSNLWCLTAFMAAELKEDPMRNASPSLYKGMIFEAFGALRGRTPTQVKPGDLAYEHCCTHILPLLLEDTSNPPVSDGVTLPLLFSKEWSSMVRSTEYSEELDSYASSYRHFSSGNNRPGMVPWVQQVAKSLRIHPAYLRQTLPDHLSKDEIISIASRCLTTINNYRESSDLVDVATVSIPLVSSSTGSSSTGSSSTGSSSTGSSSTGSSSTGFSSNGPYPTGVSSTGLVSSHSTVSTLQRPELSDLNSLNLPLRGPARKFSENAPLVFLDGNPSSFTSHVPSAVTTTIRGPAREIFQNSQTDLSDFSLGSDTLDNKWSIGELLHIVKFVSTDYLHLSDKTNPAWKSPLPMVLPPDVYLNIVGFDNVDSAKFFSVQNWNLNHLASERNSRDFATVMTHMISNTAHSLLNFSTDSDPSVHLDSMKSALRQVDMQTLENYSINEFNSIKAKLRAQDIDKGLEKFASNITKLDTQVKDLRAQVQSLEQHYTVRISEARADLEIRIQQLESQRIREMKSVLDTVVRLDQQLTTDRSDFQRLSSFLDKSRRNEPLSLREQNEFARLWGSRLRLLIAEFNSETDDHKYLISQDSVSSKVPANELPIAPYLSDWPSDYRRGLPLYTPPHESEVLIVSPNSHTISTTVSPDRPSYDSLVPTSFPSDQSSLNLRPRKAGFSPIEILTPVDIFERLARIKFVINHHQFIVNSMSVLIQTDVDLVVFAEQLERVATVVLNIKHVVDDLSTFLNSIVVSSFLRTDMSRHFSDLTFVLDKITEQFLRKKSIKTPKRSLPTPINDDDDKDPETGPSHDAPPDRNSKTIRVFTTSAASQPKTSNYSAPNGATSSRGINRSTFAPSFVSASAMQLDQNPSDPSDSGSSSDSSTKISSSSSSRRRARHKKKSQKRTPPSLGMSNVFAQTFGNERSQRQKPSDRAVSKALDNLGKLSAITVLDCIDFLKRLSIYCVATNQYPIIWRLVITDDIWPFVYAACISLFDNDELLDHPDSNMSNVSCEDIVKSLQVICAVESNAALVATLHSAITWRHLGDKVITSKDLQRLNVALNDVVLVLSLVSRSIGVNAAGISMDPGVSNSFPQTLIDIFGIAPMQSLITDAFDTHSSTKHFSAKSATFQLDGIPLVTTLMELLLNLANKLKEQEHMQLKIHGSSKHVKSSPVLVSKLHALSIDDLSVSDETEDSGLHVLSTSNNRFAPSGSGQLGTEKFDFEGRRRDKPRVSPVDDQRRFQTSISPPTSRSTSSPPSPDPRACFRFAETGTCDRPNCIYSHSTAAVQAYQQSPRKRMFKAALSMLEETEDSQRVFEEEVEVSMTEPKPHSE